MLVVDDFLWCHLFCHVYPFEFVSIAIVAFDVSCLSLHIVDGMICMASRVSQVFRSFGLIFRLGRWVFLGEDLGFQSWDIRFFRGEGGSKGGDPLFFLWFPWIFLRIPMSSNVFMVAIWLKNKHSWLVTATASCVRRCTRCGASGWWGKI